MRTCPACGREQPDTLKFCPHDGERLSGEDGPTDPMIGRTIDGRYEVLECLGGGGFGTVYRVRNIRLDDIEALKIIHSEHVRQREPLERFRREAKLLRKLGRRSTHIVDLYGLEEDRENNLFYFTMEHVPGVTLTEKVGETGAMDPGRALRLMRQICKALTLAHGEGVIHRDLKPENVLVVGEGSEERVKILDFGIAKVVDQKSLTNLSRGMPGTLGYAAPEQIQGQSAKIGAETDLFAAGVILFNLLTGRDPWTGDRVGERTTEISDWEVIRRTLEEDPVPLRKLKPDLPERLEAITSRLLAKEPEERFHSAGELDGALAEAAASLGVTPAAVEAGGFSREAGGSGLPLRRVGLVVGGVVVVAALAVGLGGILPLSGPEETSSRAEEDLTAPSAGVEPASAREGAPGTGETDPDPGVPPEGLEEGEISESGSSVALAVRPGSRSLRVGESVRLEAIRRDPSGTGPDGRVDEVAWSSDGQGIVEVDPATGVVSGLEPGTATVTARSGEETAEASLTVTAPTPVALVLEPGEAELREGQSARMNARLIDGRGNELEGEVEWSSRNPETARVEAVGPATGRIDGIAPGTTGIVATAGDLATEATVRITGIEPALTLSLPTVGFSGREVVVTFELSARGLRSSELCAATLFFGADGQPLPGEEEYTLGGQVASTSSLPSDSSGEARTVRITLPASELELNDRRYLGPNQLEVRTAVWDGSCSAAETGEPPLARGGSAGFCVARSAGGYLRCR